MYSVGAIQTNQAHATETGAEGVGAAGMQSQASPGMAHPTILIINLKKIATFTFETKTAMVTRMPGNGSSVGLTSRKVNTNPAIIVRIRMSGPYYGVGPHNYRRSDIDIQDDVCELLTQHGKIDAREIEVNVDGGEVTLLGKVSDRFTKRLAEDVALSVQGVWDVHNRLQLARK
jgi:hypothetical protein